MSRLEKLKEKIIRRLGGVPCTVLFDPVKRMNLVPISSAIEQDAGGIEVTVKYTVERKKP